MKRAYFTITYVVYEPNYVPGPGKYVKARSLVEALRYCRKFGVGATVMRCITTRNVHGGGWHITDGEWEYNPDFSKPYRSFKTKWAKTTRPR